MCVCVCVRVLKCVGDFAALFHSVRSAGERYKFSSKCIKRPLLKWWLSRQLFPSTGVVTQPLTRPHVCLSSPPPPCRLTINPAVTMATVPMHASSRFLEVRRGYSAESRVKCCPNDLGREQNKCEGEASCLCIWVESWKLGVERRGQKGRGGEGLSSTQAGRVSWTHNYEANKYVALIVQSGTNENNNNKKQTNMIALLFLFPAIWQLHLHQQLRCGAAVGKWLQALMIWTWYTLTKQTASQRAWIAAQFDTVGVIDSTIAWGTSNILNKERKRRQNKRKSLWKSVQHWGDNCITLLLFTCLK